MIRHQVVTLVVDIIVDQTWKMLQGRYCVDHVLLLLLLLVVEEVHLIIDEQETIIMVDTIQIVHYPILDQLYHQQHHHRQYGNYQRGGRNG